MSKYKFGWKPDLPDRRDFKYTLQELKPIQTIYLAKKYKMPLPYDQGNLGSCTANALSFLVHFDLLNRNCVKISNPFLPSRLFIYYYERVLEGTISSDAGAELRDGIKAIASNGVPSEDLWPYNINEFTSKPSSRSIISALNFQALEYQRLDNTNKQQLVNCLLNGFPICFGMTCYESFLSDQVAASGIIPMPDYDERIVGGHAMTIVGFSKEYDAFIVRNSWGIHWGQEGYCRIPADLICDDNVCDDFWTITKIS